MIAAARAAHREIACTDLLLPPQAVRAKHPQPRGVSDTDVWKEVRELARRALRNSEYGRVCHRRGKLLAIFHIPLSVLRRSCLRTCRATYESRAVSPAVSAGT